MLEGLHSWCSWTSPPLQQILGLTPGHKHHGAWLPDKWLENPRPGAWLLGRLLRHTPFGEGECQTGGV